MGVRYIDAAHFKKRILAAAESRPNTGLEKAANVVCDLIDQEPTAIRWILLSEGVPPDEKPVYVLTTNKAQFIARYNHKYHRFGAPGSVCITHWMPMLAGPEDNEDG